MNRFLLYFNNRNDNLGDQFIFRNLVRFVSSYGDVEFTPGAKVDFLHSGHRCLQQPRVGGVLATAAKTGASFRFAPPGATLWPSSAATTWKPVEVTLNGLSVNVVRSVCIGCSVIPAADHSWCKQMSILGVRDDRSLRALKASGHLHAQYFPDLTFAGTRHALLEIPRITTALSFRSLIPENRWNHSHQDMLVAALMEAVPRESAHRQNWAVFHQVDEDSGFNQSLCERFEIDRNHGKVGLPNMASFYGAAGFVISNRLHCLLLAAYHGAIPIALISREHDKISGLFETVGWKDLIVYSDDRYSIKSRLRMIFEGQSQLLLKIAETFARQGEIARQFMNRHFIETE